MENAGFSISTCLKEPTGDGSGNKEISVGSDGKTCDVPDAPACVNFARKTGHDPFNLTEDAKAWGVPFKQPKPIDTTNYDPDDTESNFWHWHPGGQTTFAALGYGS